MAGDPKDSIADGEATVLDIRNQYNDTSENCGTNNRPAFLCNGVIIRATAKSDKYKSWNPSPKSIERGGVSFSYLRRDSKFGTFAWSSTTTNGYIIYPKLKVVGKTPIDVLCSYPMDSWEWHREKPCGSYLEDGGKYKDASRLCSSQGINTAEQWLAQLNKFAPGNQYVAQCGFDVRKTTPNNAIAFNESLRAQQQLGRLPEWNELQLETWGQDLARTLPIQAFFYTTPESMASAKANQKEFYEATGNTIIVPVIKVKLPASQMEDVIFEFNANDQAITSSVIAITDPPIIDYPAEGASMSSPFRISGRSAPYASVYVYTAGGARAFGTPVADARGVWYIDNVVMSSAQPITALQSLNGEQSNWAQNRNFSINATACPSFIASASWISRYDPRTQKNEWSLSVIPTACGRKTGSHETDAAYAELVRKYGNDAYWIDNDRGGMRRQFVCHVVIAREKSEWNLEPFRPDVSHETSIANRCNPI